MGTECDWLTRHDECTDLSGKLKTELLQALDLAIDFVDYCRAGHTLECKCDSCVWLKQARSFRVDQVF